MVYMAWIQEFIIEKHGITRVISGMEQGVTAATEGIRSNSCFSSCLSLLMASSMILLFQAQCISAVIWNHLSAV